MGYIFVRRTLYMFSLTIFFYLWYLQWHCCHTDNGT
jgi:hypothetical protein